MDTFSGLAASLTVLPLVVAPSHDDASLEEIVNDSGDGFRHDCYNSELYRQYMEYLLPFFDKQGILG